MSESNIDVLFQITTPRLDRPISGGGFNPQADAFSAQLSLQVNSTVAETVQVGEQHSSSTRTATSGGRLEDRPPSTNESNDHDPPELGDEANHQLTESPEKAVYAVEPNDEVPGTADPASMGSNETTDEGELEEPQPVDEAVDEEDDGEPEAGDIVTINALEASIDIGSVAKDKVVVNAEAHSIDGKSDLSIKPDKSGARSTTPSEAANGVPSAAELELPPSSGNPETSAATSAGLDSESTILVEPSHAESKQGLPRPNQEGPTAGAKDSEVRDSKKRPAKLDKASKSTATNDNSGGESEALAEEMQAPRSELAEIATTFLEESKGDSESPAAGKDSTDRRTVGTSDSRVSTVATRSPQVANVPLNVSTNLGSTSQSSPAVFSKLQNEVVSNAASKPSLPTDAASLSPPRRSFGINALNSHEGTEKAEGPRVDTARFVNRVTRAFHFAQERGGTLQLRLSPPELGALRLELTVKEGVLSASLEAETPAARRLLLDNLPALRDRLAEQNVRVERFDVDIRREEHDTQRNAFHHGQQQHQEQEREERQPQTSRAAGRHAPKQKTPVTVENTMSAVTTNSGINLVI